MVFLLNNAIILPKERSDDDWIMKEARLHNIGRAVGLVLVCVYTIILAPGM